jgi:hypothetical protein
MAGMCVRAVFVNTQSHGSVSLRERASLTTNRASALEAGNKTPGDDSLTLLPTSYIPNDERAKLLAGFFGYTFLFYIRCFFVAR